MTGQEPNSVRPHKLASNRQTPMLLVEEQRRPEAASNSACSELSTNPSHLWLWKPNTTEEKLVLIEIQASINENRNACPGRPPPASAALSPDRRWFLSRHCRQLHLCHHHYDYMYVTVVNGYQSALNTFIRLWNRNASAINNKLKYLHEPRHLLY